MGALCCRDCAAGSESALPSDITAENPPRVGGHEIAARAESESETPCKLSCVKLTAGPKRWL